MTAFKTATNTVGGIAFGLFLVVAVPAMGILTIGSGLFAAVGTYTSIEGETLKARKDALAPTVASFVIFLVACAGDIGLLSLLLKLNKDNKK